MNTNYAPRPGTARELKRQANFLETIMKRSDEKHEALQAGRREKVAKLRAQTAIAEQLEDMEAAL